MQILDELKLISQLNELNGNLEALDIHTPDFESDLLKLEQELLELLPSNVILLQ